MPAPYLNYQQSYAPQSYQQNPQSYGQSYGPQSYAQQSFAPQSFAPQQMSQPSSTINWVQGDIGARAYPVGPNTSVLLMDSEGQNFYIKSADVSGMPTMKKYAYSEVIEEPMRLESHEAKQIDSAFSATREEVKQLHEEINALKGQIAQMEIENRNLQEQTKTGGRKNG